MTREQLIKHWDVIKAFKEGKEIQCRKIGSEQWNNEHGGFEFRLNYEYREKPEEPKPTKRLPTIEEVEKWFMENMVFVYKKTGTYERIATFNSTRYTPICNFDKEWLTIEEFCQLYSNIDGSELYITENEKPKLTYGGEIADFPIEIVERMLERQVEQGNKRDVSVFERNKMAGNYGFVWERTKEGLFFWQEVIVCKDFDLFFEKYPKKSNQ